jgi:hypothetical protein
VSADLKWAEPINAASKSRHDRAKVAKVPAAKPLESHRRVDPVIHAFLRIADARAAKTWIAGSSPAMTGWIGEQPMRMTESFLAKI